MKGKPIFIGKNKASFKATESKGDYVNFEEEHYYKISDSDTLRPFFMSIVSDSNNWMFISSNGGISAGRKNSDQALFPYYTDDKITESAEITGSKTVLQIHQEDKIFLWEPFSVKHEGAYAIQRNLYKNSFGNKIVFEEINTDLGLTFRYQWNSSNLFGFVRKATLINNAEIPCRIVVLDGIQNIMPYGLSADIQNSFSNLADAYKKSELEPDVGLGIFALSAVIVDKPEPSEALKANIVWSLGLEEPKYLISSLQLNTFRKGQEIQQETDIRAEKGAYFISSDLLLPASTEKAWVIVANVNQGPSQIVEIAEKLKSKTELYEEVVKDIELGTKNLLQLSGSADGLQLTNDPLQDSRHFSNVLFNIMRGGIFDENYQIEASDFLKYIAKANNSVFSQFKKQLQNLPPVFNLQKLKDIAFQNEDSDFKRLCLEYMPLKFSRRHGDPSRPWNKFSINTRNEIDGSKVLDYEGNWRDIFQNWEALAHSYPDFIESMIHKFLNASTFEGYNPYRVTKGGFDWEVIEPDDPWSFIGYWGDHQIVYLLKFLEFAENHFPNKLEKYFDQDIFVFANVPYKIKSYSEIIKNPKDTIDFDHKLNEFINKRKESLGADGALLFDQNNSIHKVNLIEKLLITALAKCSNFIPEAGIWLNTQRPEWNDANNALVGNGVSMVTLFYLRRYMDFLSKIINKTEANLFEVSDEFSVFFEDVAQVFNQFKHLLSDNISDIDRKSIVDGLGNAGGNYRLSIYKNKHSGTKKSIAKNDLISFLKVSIAFFDHSIDANKRINNLFHSYNLMTVKSENEISIAHLPEMLEGQVAVLSSSKLSSIECLSILHNLKTSKLYRPDQNSFVLYPDKQLARFIDKNNIPKQEVEKSSLLTQLLKDENSQIIEKDVLGNYHFNGNFNNANSLKEAFSKLDESKYKKLIEKEDKLVLGIFEKVFNHKSFTGRSGTFFGYEGLGSIYWHMVSKLLLAVQEACFRSIENQEDKIIINALINQYYEIKEGIGLHKSPKTYGAFPTDPYSHTPAGKGAQQPGMTGQVKEDILSRIGELGVLIKDGKLIFNPTLLRKEEFLDECRIFKYTDINHQENEINLAGQSLCFSYCQVPIVYKLSTSNYLKVVLNNNTTVELEGLELDIKLSRYLFERSGDIKKISVSINKDLISRER